MPARVYLTRPDRAAGAATVDLLCPRCGLRLPFTGAFEFVMCPNCKGAVYVAQAARAPSAPPSGFTLPQSLPPAEALSLFQIPDELPPPLIRRVARHATTLGVAVCLFILLANLVVLVVGIPAALAYALSGAEPFVPIYVVFPFPILLGRLGGEAAAAWHMGLASAIIASAAHFLRGHLPGAWAAFMRVFEGRGSPPLSEPNGLFALVRLFSVSILASIAVAAIAGLFNQTPAVPVGLDTEPFGALLVTLAHASVYEELLTRVLLLGVPLLALHYLGRGRLEGPPHRYLLGGGFTIGGPALALLVFQAAVFGAAHVPGWDLWKFPSTFVTGLALGYLFLRYGLSACIVFHFLTDYATATVLFTEHTNFPLLILVGLVVVVPAVGVVNGIRYLFVLNEWRRLGRIPEYVGGPAPRAPPAPAAPLPVGLVPPPMQHVSVYLPPTRPPDPPPPPPAGPG